MIVSVGLETLRMVPGDILEEGRLGGGPGERCGPTSLCLPLLCKYTWFYHLLAANWKREKEERRLIDAERKWDSSARLLCLAMRRHPFTKESWRKVESEENIWIVRT